MTDPYAALEAANIGLANVLSYRTYSGSRTPGRVEWDSAQRALDLVRAALDARPEPVAWQTQRPVRLTDERVDEIGLAFDWRKMPIAAYGRAVEAEVLKINGIDTSAERGDSGGEDRHG